MLNVLHIPRFSFRIFFFSFTFSIPWEVGNDSSSFVQKLIVKRDIKIFAKGVSFAYCKNLSVETLKAKNETCSVPMLLNMSERELWFLLDNLNFYQVITKLTKWNAKTSGEKGQNFYAHHVLRKEVGTLW